MAMTVDQNKLVTNAKYAEEVYKNEGNKYNVDNTIREIIEDNYSYKQLQQWKADMSDAGKDSNDYEVNIDEGVDETTGTKKSDKTDDDKKVDGDSKNDKSKTKVVRKDEGDLGAAKTRKTGVLLGGGLAAACGGYVLLTGGMGAGVVMIGSIGLAAAAFTAFTVAMTYLTSNPNKKENEELQTLKQSMLENDVELANAQIKLKEAKGEVEVVREEVEQTEKEADEEIKAKEEELAKKQERIDELNEKAQSEEGLTEEEKSELETLTGEAQALHGELETMREDAAAEVEEGQEEAAGKQEVVEEASGVFESALDVADYAATFDEQTKEAAEVEAQAQTMNAVLGFGTAAAISINPLLGLTPAGHVARAMALFGGVTSTVGAIEQNNISKEVAEEIGVRKAVQAQAAHDVEEAEEVKTDVEDTVTVAEETVENLEETNEAEAEEIAETTEQPVAPAETEETEEAPAEQPEEGKEEKEPKEEV